MREWARVYVNACRASLCTFSIQPSPPEALTILHVQPFLTELRPARYEELKPYLQRIDTVSEGVDQLLLAARQLDDYSKRLGALDRVCSGIPSRVRRDGISGQTCLVNRWNGGYRVDMVGLG